MNQEKLERQVDALVAKNASGNQSLLDFGYDSIGLDDGWQACGTGVNGSFHSSAGKPLVDHKKFPSMKSFVDYAHKRNVKMGWYHNNCGVSDHVSMLLYLNVCINYVVSKHIGPYQRYAQTI